MRRFAWALVAAGILAGCAPTMATLPAGATVNDRQRSEACHAVALKALEDDPAPARPPAHWSAYIPTPERIAATGLLLVTAPVWYPIMKSRENQRRYDAAFDRCMIHGPGALATAGHATCYQELARDGVGPAFCPRDIVEFTLPVPDAHWGVRR